jgi:hypothetical protein
VVVAIDPNFKTGLPALLRRPGGVVGILARTLGTGNLSIWSLPLLLPRCCHFAVIVSFVGYVCDSGHGRSCGRDLGGEAACVAALAGVLEGSNNVVSKA